MHSLTCLSERLRVGDVARGLERKPLLPHGLTQEGVDGGGEVHPQVGEDAVRFPFQLRVSAYARGDGFNGCLLVLHIMSIAAHIGNRPTEARLSLSFQ